jgi:large subunit ribosomal protein L17
MTLTLGGRKLGRRGAHKRAMLSNMATSLFLHERIQTTSTKAKELRGFAEKLIGKARKGDRLEVRRVIRDKAVFDKLFDVLAPRYKERPGGFIQILKMGRRPGDNSEVSLVRLVS